MITINSLSPADKLNVKWERTNRLMVSNYVLIIIIQLFFVSIFLLAIGYLKIEDEKINKILTEAQLDPEIKEINSIKRETGEADKKLNSLLELQKKQFHWTETINIFNEIIPEGIKINDINIEPQLAVPSSKNKTSPKAEEGVFSFKISGSYKTIDNLLEFENNISNSENFIDFKIDPKNYNRDNFNYSFLIRMKTILSS